MGGICSVEIGSCCLGGVRTEELAIGTVIVAAVDTVTVMTWMESKDLLHSDLPQAF